ncbi:uncharacterized protein At4g17910 [Physcomitrium patens]|uniref:GPI-anchored wall transfer protein n=1 Tax=Physcomitrium patens TaxID=3218 RepID=A9SNV8_PHYPA|nr:uncharacterized protein At4g17910-like isoform X1 [Physcomitrium patens]XP_024397387.1 uncharacterized protein At4g17910-like isoform X1 [Physcomitrium patens]PNR39324.1 hypothetical protein PHYPA_019602 [Physcomitrium patens]|eukprot:XP_024397386.1 uncharacterized protein At4g17910-like isoform X1 [Physcomitrella patens]
MAYYSYSPDLMKRLKEEFVSNLEGTTMREIAAMSALFPAFLLLRQCWPESSVLKPETGSSEEDSKSSMIRTKFWRSILLDFLVIVVPAVACLTVLADWLYTILPVTFGLLFLVLGSKRSQSSSIIGTPVEKNRNATRKIYLSSYRFVMMLVTCMTILAIDFTVFPRRYGKTETYGTGLMDLGVGSFVVANALVSRQARNLPPSKYGGVLRNTSPLLLLGFIRLIVTKGVDYQEHVGEYGVHWNFFFTLAGVSLLTSLISIKSSWCGPLGITILAVYQIVLSSGLNVYLLSPQRGQGLLSLNKEGIASTFGYWGLYLISVHLGYLLNSKQTNVVQTISPSSNIETEKKAVTLRRGVVVGIWVLDVFLWVLTVWADYFVERISRRTCNLSYVLFVLAQNFEVIGIFMLAEVLAPLREIAILNVFDRNMLPTFLLANLLTGLVNMSMYTIFVAPAKAVVVVMLYALTLVGLMGLVDVKKLKLKFW